MEPNQAGTLVPSSLESELTGAIEAWSLRNRGLHVSAALETTNGFKWKAKSSGDASAVEIFPVLSLAELILIAILARFARLHLLTWDDPIQRWIKDPLIPANLTLRQIVSHRAGLPDFATLKSYKSESTAKPGQAWPRARFFDSLIEGPDFGVGEARQFSALGLLLLRDVAEACGRSTLKDLVHDEICRPLQLRSTYVFESAQEMYELTGNLLDPGWLPFGFIASTAEETAAIVKAIFEGRLIETSCFAEIEAVIPRITIDRGLGYAVTTRYSEPTRASGIAAVVMANCEKDLTYLCADLTRIARELL